LNARVRQRKTQGSRQSGLLEEGGAKEEEKEKDTPKSKQSGKAAPTAYNGSEIRRKRQKKNGCRREREQIG